MQHAHDAHQALRIVATEPAFDVVLTDVVMPGELDGLALAETLQHAHPTLTVLLISGYNTAAAQGVFRVLSKPCPPDELLAALSQAVATTARRRAQAVAGPGPAAR